MLSIFPLSPLLLHFDPACLLQSLCPLLPYPIYFTVLSSPLLPFPLFLFSPSLPILPVLLRHVLYPSLPPSLSPSLPPSLPPSIAPYSHTQQSGYWASVQIPVFSSPQWGGNNTITIQQSIAAWRRTFANLSSNESPTERILARQSCHEPHCIRHVCPESFDTSIDKSLQWLIVGRIVVVACVLAILVCSIAMWLFLKLHYCCLHHRQRNYLDNHTFYRNHSMTDAGPYSVS